MPDRRRESFDEVADDYARYRSAPPRAAVDDLARRAGIAEGSRVVEIGCGTGQLSVPLARRGPDLTCVELGPHLAQRARTRLARYPRARVIVADFEAWPGPQSPSDAVVACNCFHWLSPDSRLDRCADALAVGGALGIIHVSPVAGGTPGFLAATNPIYLDYGLSPDPDFALPPAAEVPHGYPELEPHRAFTAVTRRRFSTTRRYSTERFLGLLRTDSLINTLEPGARDAFLAAIRRVVEGVGAEVSQRFLYEVIVARRID